MQPAPTDLPRRLCDLFVEHAPALVAWLRLRTHTTGSRRTDIEDMAQEVWVRAVQNAHKQEPLRASFRTWLFGIAANVVLEVRRSDQRLGRTRIADGRSTIVEQMHQVPDDVTSVTGCVARSEALGALLERIERGDSEDRRIFQLRGLEGRPHSAVAKLLGITVEAATKRWLRLMDSLRSIQVPQGLFAE